MFNESYVSSRYVESLKRRLGEMGALVNSEIDIVNERVVQVIVSIPSLYRMRNINEHMYLCIGNRVLCVSLEQQHAQPHLVL